jgi:hypothetical protein
MKRSGRRSLICDEFEQQPKAFKTTLADPAFLVEAQKSQLDIEFVSGEETERRWNRSFPYVREPKKPSLFSCEKESKEADMKNPIYSSIVMLGSALLATTFSPAVADEFYKGKTIRVVVGAAAGGG